MNVYNSQKSARQASGKYFFALFLLLGSFLLHSVSASAASPASSAAPAFASPSSVPPSIFNVPVEVETDTASKPIKRPVIVAVIDTGVDCHHPDLAPFLWNNPDEIPGDGIDNDGNGYIDDVYGWDFYHNDNTICHYKNDPQTESNEPAPTSRIPNPTDNDNHGTHIAGIIVSQAEKLDCSVQIMSLKVLGGGCSAGSFGTGSIAHTIEAIQYAEAMGADICCLSWGTSVHHRVLEQTIRESGMLFVAAAGNSSSDNDETPVYPASFDLENLISVASTDKAAKSLSVFSNYGVSSVDLAAPGENIRSTVIEGYAVMSGTSMSAPSVCAAAALLYASSTQLSAAQIKTALLSGGKSVPSLKGSLAYPVVPDPKKSLSLLDSCQTDQVAPQLVWQTNYETTCISVQIHASDQGGSGIRTIRYLPGRQNLTAFRLGQSGIPIPVDGTEPLTLSKPGYYTFYLCDYAGNETSYVIPVWQSPHIIVV